ncbi:MAG: peptidoglycan-binding domain-containing protein [Actinomycetota bacterium]
MKTSVLPLAVLGLLAAAPAFAEVVENRPMEQVADVNLVQGVVAAAQQRLSQMGYNVQPSGRIDQQTVAGVQRFQADHGLRATGHVDLETLAALGIDPNVGGRSVAMGREPGQQYAMAEPGRGPVPADRGAYAMLDEPLANQRADAAGESRFVNPRIPVLRFSEHMSSPQFIGQGYEIESQTGVPESTADVVRGQVGALPAGTFLDNRQGGLWD